MSAPRWRSGEAYPLGLIAVVAVTLALRLAAGGLTHLTEDEAYYRLWSLSPAFGYFDHPPMIAWWIWLGRHLAGDTALGVRLPAILATAVIGLLVFDLTRLAGGTRPDAERAGLFFNATFLVLGGGFLAVPDAPASLFWTLCLWCALRAHRSERSGWWWALAGLAAGLACLSKYSALFLAPGMILWLAASPEGRRRLDTPGPWLAAVIAATVFSPNIVWNADHGWLTFAKQFGRIAPHAFQPRHVSELIASQVLLLNPLIAGCAVAAGLGRRDHLDLRPFALVSAPFAAYLVVHSLHDRVQAHWPAPLYPMAAVCAAAGAARLSGRWRLMAKAAVPVGFAAGVLGLAILAAPGAWFGRYDLALPVRGWRPFAAGLTDLARAHRAGWVGTTSYGLAAELADEPGLHAPVIQLAERERWRGLDQPRVEVFRSPGLVVDLPRRLAGPRLADCFATATPLPALIRGDPGEPGKAYAVFLVSGPRRDLRADGCPGL